MTRSRLLRVIQNLKIDQQYLDVHEFKFNKTKITQVVKNLENISSATKPFVSNDSILVWKEYLVHKKIEVLTRKDLKQLSWHNDVSLTNDFFICLQKRNIKISKSIGKGLLFSLLTKWKTASIEDIKSMIENGLKSDNPGYYQQIEKYVFRNDGAKVFSEELLENEKGVLEHITDKLGITSSTNQFCESVYDCLVKNHYKVLLSNNSKKRKWFFDNVLSALTKEQILKCIELVVTENDVPNEDAKEDLKQFILFYPHLGDPRLPGYEGNWPKNHKVTNLFIEWLSQSDIKFFFELFIDSKEDIQDRKTFWLRYAHLVKGTRVILSLSDQQKYARQITEMQNRNNYGRLFGSLKGKINDSTAFMMDFGEVIIVEFSQKNNSCFLYTKNSSFPYADRQKFWNESEFQTSVLKSSEKRLAHNPKNNWHDKFENAFVRDYGLRPKKNEKWKIR